MGKCGIKFKVGLLMQQGDLVQELTHAELTKERSKYHHFSFPVQGMYFDLVISSISTCQYLCMKIQKHNTPLHTLLPLGRQWVNKHMPDGSCIAQCTTGRHSVAAETNTAHRKSLYRAVPFRHCVVIYPSAQRIPGPQQGPYIFSNKGQWHILDFTW